MALDHLHQRKRIHQHHEKYPHPDKFKRILDKTMFGVGFLGPVFTVPQIWRIWAHQTAEGVSLLSWLMFVIGAMLWALYGIVHKEKPIIFAWTLASIANILVVVGILIYG